MFNFVSLLATTSATIAEKVTEALGTAATTLAGATNATTTATTVARSWIENLLGVDAPFLGTIVSFLPMVLIVVLMYFLMIRPQKKKQKEEQQMRDSLRVGDQITTIGGICGRVVNIKEDTLVIETGADRSKMTIKKWAMQSCDTVHEASDDDDDDDI